MNGIRYPYAFVHPELEPAVVRATQLDVGEAVVALKVGETVVEARRTDRPRLSEVVLQLPSTVTLSVGMPLVRGAEHRLSRCREDDRIDGRHAERGIAVGPTAVGARIRPTFVAVVVTDRPWSKSAYSMLTASENG